MKEHWIRTDEAEDVAASIRHALRTAVFVAGDPQAWKWVILALHAALQGACICHLTTTAAPVGAVTKRNAAEWITFFEAQRTDPEAKAPDTHLMGLPDLLKAIRKAHSAGDRSNANGIGLSDIELSWLKDIHGELRNQFVHFEPMGWAIEISGIAEFAHLVARILGEMLMIGWAFRHLEFEQRDAMRRDLLELGPTLTRAAGQTP